MPGPKKRMTPAQRAELWRRFKAGQSVVEIGRALGTPRKTVHWNLLSAGGIAPTPRRRRQGWLTAGEREEISRGLSVGESLRTIAARLERAPSTVSREIARNAGRVMYRAEKADTRAWARALRPKQCKLATHARLRRFVASKLLLEWSPAQISGWLKKHHTDDEMKISHEAIYRSLFVQARGVLKKELQAHLRRSGAMRKSKKGKV